ncbi:MAG: hypothetical protein J5595_08415, partial [Bacteroidales bacterium]|nr:hypothetical protein [Bacteroidales bacterium]
KRVAEHNYSLTLTQAAKDFLTEKGYDPKFGARPLKRAIQKYLEDELAEVLLETEITEGLNIVADVDESGEKLKINVLSNDNAEKINVLSNDNAEKINVLSNDNAEKND